MSDEYFISRCIEIAKYGSGFVSPNPLVGCVIIKDGEFLSEGYHKVFGGPHAEVNAINNSPKSVEGATLFVNLEPCSHTGKTPPCTNLIIEKKIKRVVIGAKDPNPLVSGKGIAILKEKGIDVKVGILETECIELNRFFYKYHNSGMPYISIKVAQTLDGKIADSYGDSKWITGEASRKYVHTLRSEFDAVLVGVKTIKKDNPFLDSRLIAGRNPYRVILDSALSSPLRSEVFIKDSKSIIIRGKFSSEKDNERIIKKEKALLKIGVKVIPVSCNKDGSLNLREALKKLTEIGIISVLVEGGAKVFSSFIVNNLFDELILFTAPKILGGGLCSIDSIAKKKIADIKMLKFVNSAEIDGDVVTKYYNK